MLFAYFDTAYYLLPIPRTACKQNRLPAEVHWINQCNAATYLQLSPGQQIRLFTKTVSQQQSCLKSGNSLCLLCLISKKLVISPGWCSSVDRVRAANQMVASSIPRQGTCLGCRPGPQCRAYERQPHTIFIPIFFSFPPLLSENK